MLNTFDAMSGSTLSTVSRRVLPWPGATGGGGDGVLRPGICFGGG